MGELFDHLRSNYLDWPHEVSIETFAKCNASCTFCPYTTLDRIGAKMPDEMIDRLIGELKDHPHPFMVSPFKVNEPFLDKRLLPICRKINADLPNAWLRLFTNGSALTEAHIDGVNELERVVHLWTSLNEHEPDAYRALMGLDFDRTAANLDVLHAKIVAGQFRHPAVVSKVRSDDPARDDAFVEYVRERWPRFGCHLIKRDGWLGYVEPGSPEIPHSPCVRWFELSITATGEVSMCCMDGAAEFKIGDLREQTLFEVYNGKSWRDRRQRMLSRRDLPGCMTCTY